MDETASNFIDKLLGRAPAQRDAAAVDNANDAVRAQNQLRAEIAQKAKDSGLATNGLLPVARVDDQGRLQGFSGDTRKKA